MLDLIADDAEPQEEEEVIEEPPTPMADDDSDDWGTTWRPKKRKPVQRKRKLPPIRDWTKEATSDERPDIDIPDQVTLERRENRSPVVVPSVALGDAASAYHILRAFSWQLRLSPMPFEEFCMAVFSPQPTPMADELYICILRALAEDETKAERAERTLDLALLDAVTWPDGDAGPADLRNMLQATPHTRPAEVEYNSLPAETKAAILVRLTGDLLEVRTIRAEIDRRETSGQWVGGRGGQGGAWAMRSLEERARRAEAGSDQEAADAAEVGEDGDGNTDNCVLCGLGGSLLCCDGCPAAYHMRCIGESAKSIPDGEWLCAECSLGGRGESAGLRVAVAGYNAHKQMHYLSHGTLIHSARARCCHGGQDAVEEDPVPVTRYVGQAAVERAKELKRVKGEEAPHSTSTEWLADPPVPPAGSCLAAEIYLNRYRNGWSAAGVAMKNWVEEAVRRRGKGTPGRFGTLSAPELPVPVPISRFQWPLSAGKGSNQKVLEKCGACFHCLNPAKHKPCLRPISRLDGSASEAAETASKLVTLVNYALKVEREVWALAEGPWADEEGMTFRRTWVQRVRSATHVEVVAACLLQLEAAMRPLILIEAWAPERRLGSRRGPVGLPGGKTPGGSRSASQNPSRQDLTLSTPANAAQQAKAGETPGETTAARRLRERSKGISYNEDSLVLDVDDEEAEEGLAADAYDTADLAPPSGARDHFVRDNEGVKAHSDWVINKRSRWLRFGRHAHLPQDVARRAAKQGGLKRIAGVRYGSKHPVLTPRLAWRGSMQAALTASQLALQLRSLDAHVQWEGLKRPPADSDNAMVNAELLQKRPAAGGGFEYLLQMNTDGGDEEKDAGASKPKGKKSKAKASKAATPAPSAAPAVPDATGSPGGSGQTNAASWVHESRLPLWLVRAFEERARRELAARAANAAREALKLSDTRGGKDAAKRAAKAAAAAAADACGVCGVLYDDDDEVDFWIGCDTCNRWYHGNCVSVTKEEADGNDEWECPECIAFINQKQQRAAHKARQKRHASAAKGEGLAEAKRKQAAKGRKQGKAKKKAPVEEDDAPQLYCICQRPDDGTASGFVQCEECEEWYHPECVGVTLEEVQAMEGGYICDLCARSRKRSAAAKSRRAEAVDAAESAGEGEVGGNKRKRNLEDAEDAEAAEDEAKRAKQASAGLLGTPGISSPAGEAPKDWRAAALRVLGIVMSMPLAAPFCMAITDEDVPGYTTIIKRPMDFARVRAKLEKGDYHHAAEVFAAVKLIWKNCNTFNAAESDIVRQAAQVERVFRANWQKQALPRSLPKGLVAEAEADEVVKAVLRLKSAWPFSAPVDEALVPGYHSIITQPMDLLTMSQRLQAGEYTTLGAILADAQLVWANCRLFNAGGSDICALCDETQAAFGQRAPVDEALVPGYRSIITQPMDLLTISQRLQAGEYTTLGAILADVQLVWSNCHAFNAEGSDICRLAADHSRRYGRDSGDS
ncbi:hypothetical protein WJX72_010117 [[Myrmecia] bisecta]|uniref:Uncharacterized protein n=1 Tax=[Myrmecia] bisecta TaxID=41462 RepID=A0AAW1Q1M2_9CHLO